MKATLIFFDISTLKKTPLNVLIMLENMIKTLLVVSDSYVATIGLGQFWITILIFMHLGFH